SPAGSTWNRQPGASANGAIRPGAIHRSPNVLAGSPKPPTCHTRPSTGSSLHRDGARPGTAQGPPTGFDVAPRSATNNSRPASGSVTANHSFPPASVSSVGFEPSLPGIRSAKSRVPAGVPSVSHGSRPTVGQDEAPKKASRLPIAAKDWGRLEPTGSTSASRRVPAAVPSLIQGSTPRPSVAR